jgi:CHAT domain-containing protein/Tfp pilus assembly protein PilF
MNCRLVLLISILLVAALSNAAQEKQTDVRELVPGRIVGRTIADGEVEVGGSCATLSLGLRFVALPAASIQDETLQQATRLDQQVVELSRQARYNEAIPLAQRALDIRLRILGAAHPDYAKSLSNLAQLYLHTGRYDKAEPLLLQATDIYKKELGPTRPDYLTSLNSLAGLYVDTGRHEKALEFYNQALPLERGAGNKGSEAETLQNIGNAYNSLGEKQRALEFYNQARPLLRAVGDMSGEAATLNNIGIVYDDLGEKQKALAFFTQALPLKRAVGDRNGEAIALNNIGALYHSIGEPKEAVAFFTQALVLNKQLGDRFGEANSLNNIGATYDSLKEEQKALDFYQQALMLYSRLADRVNESNTLLGIGNVYNSLGRHEEAVASYSNALAWKRELQDVRGEAKALHNLGTTYEDLGLIVKALHYYGEALSLVRLAKDLKGEAAILNSLMLAWQATHASVAIFYGKQSVNAYQQLRSSTSGSEKVALERYIHSERSPYRGLADILITQGRLPEAQQVLGLLKEEEYFEYVSRDPTVTSLSAARVSFTPTEGELEKQFRILVDRMAEISSQRSALLAQKVRNAADEQRLSQLDSQIGTANVVFQKYLDQLEVELNKEKAGSKDVNFLRDAQPLMDTLRSLHAVALYTFVGRDKYRLVLITPEVQKAYEYPIKEAELNRKIFAFRDTLQNRITNALPQAQELYQILFGPELARDLAQAKAETLMWSLDGTLRYLPIAALHDGQNYLVEKYRSVVFTPASRDHLKDPVSPSWQALGLGVSLAHDVTNADTKATLHFRALPNVKDELEGIVADQSAGTATKGVLSGKMILDEPFTADAMEAALRLRGDEQTYKLVHIASHFNFDPGDYTKSFLLMGSGPPLTMSQLRAMPNLFSKVELLTLSACDTATGEREGEGKEVEGFAVLAQRQGAEAIIASLWSVADSSTSELMQEFYRSRQSQPPLTKAEALRQAQLKLLRSDKYGHPYFWAPFILIGNWK